MMYDHLPFWAQELCHDVERNDPSLTSVTAVGMETNVAIALASALNVNSIVTDVHFDLSFVNSTGIDALKNMLTINTSIESLRIETCFNDHTIRYPCQESRKHEHECSRAGIARGLLQNTSIKKLIIEGAGLDDEFWTALSNREFCLEELHVSRAELSPSFVHFLETSSIIKLSISNSIVYTGENDTNFVDTGLLNYALPAATQHRTVRLSSVVVRQGTKQYDLDSSLMARFINIARFQSNILYIERGFTAECAVALAAHLKTNTTLKRLYLPENPLGGVGVAALADMLQHNTTITMMDIRNVFIDDEEMAASALGRALERNSSLTDLRLADNCGIDFSKPIAAALRVNCTLKSFNLSSTTVGTGGAAVLANALEQNRTLRVLELRKCNLSNAGAIAMAIMLLQNKTLQTLDLSQNELSESSSRILLDALQHNYTLKTLALDAPTETFRQELNYWNRLSPCGRAILTRNVMPSLISTALHRISKDGGPQSLYTILCERPDLVMR